VTAEDRQKLQGYQQVPRLQLTCPFSGSYGIVVGRIVFPRRKFKYYHLLFQLPSSSLFSSSSLFPMSPFSFSFFLLLLPGNEGNQSLSLKIKSSDLGWALLPVTRKE
jgi:hypothetical protein